MAQGIVELGGDLIAYEELGDVSAATSITASNLYSSDNLQAQSMLVVIEDNSVRVQIDGTAPTNAAGDGTDNGIKLADGDSILIRGHSAIKNFQAIESTSGSTAYVHVWIFA